MSTKDQVKRIQEALIAKGYDVGPDGADGWSGPNTLAAIKKFQKDVGLTGSGIVGPKTLTALGLAEKPEDVPAADVRVPWYDEVMRKRSLHEGRDFTELSKYLKSDGKTLGDPRKLPWCGDLVETAIRLALPGSHIPQNPYLARNWAKWGVPLKKGAKGAVLVFWRGNPAGTSGHVGFYHGEDATHFHVLGGNQDNQISVARIAKNRLVKNGIRWPAGINPPTTGAVVRSKDGVITTTNEA